MLFAAELDIYIPIDYVYTGSVSYLTWCFIFPSDAYSFAYKVLSAFAQSDPLPIYASPVPVSGLPVFNPFGLPI